MTTFRVTEAGRYQITWHYGTRPIRPGLSEIVEQATEIWLIHKDDDGNVTDAELKDFRLGAEPTP